MCMENWPWMKQLDLWPRPMSPEEMDNANDEFRKASDEARRKGEDLVSKEEVMEAAEGKGAKRILSRKESAAQAGKVVEKLERDAVKREKEGGDKKKE